tara:strand:+ start:333 stop:926 length:594 start_codon:yes stop_codon:yes gene_type:complete
MNEYEPSLEPIMEQSHLNKAKSDKFLMVLDLPDALKSINTANDRASNHVNSDSIIYSVYSTQIPEVHVSDKETKFSGQTFHFTSHSRPEYGNIKVDFTVDSQFNNYWVIYKWINLLNNNKEGFFDAESLSTVDNPYESYSTTITVFGLDEYNKKRIQFDFIGVVPVKLGSIQYNYRSDKDIESSFEFSFSQMIAKLI